MVFGRVPGMTFGSMYGSGLSRQTFIVQNTLTGEYENNLLDDDYMDRMIQGLEKATVKRRHAFDRHVRTNSVILGALVAQAVAGIFIALWMTVMQPSYDFSTDVKLEDVDVVFMVDASEHAGSPAKVEQTTQLLTALTERLFSTMDAVRVDQFDFAVENMVKLQHEKASWLQRLFRPHPDATNKKQRDKVLQWITRSRGFLRVASLLFNAEVFSEAGQNGMPPESATMHTLSPCTDDHCRTAVDELKHNPDEKFRATAQQYDAMNGCLQIIKDATQRSKDKFGSDPSLRIGERCWKDEGGPSCSLVTGIQECSVTWSRWCTFNEATQTCEEKPPLCRRQFCIILGGTDAMCKRRGSRDDKVTDTWKTNVDNFCDYLNKESSESAESNQDVAGRQGGHPPSIEPHADTDEATADSAEPAADGAVAADAVDVGEPMSLCPAKHEVDKFGNQLEWWNEMNDCITFYAESMSAPFDFGRIESFEGDRALMHWDVDLMNTREDIKMVMIFLVGSEAEKQLRFKNAAFRNLLESSLDCPVAETAKHVMHEGVEHVISDFQLDESGGQCNRFMMETDFTELLKKVERISDLLQADITQSQSPNSDQDFKYLFFLLLPVLLLLYLGTMQLLRWYSQHRLDSARFKRKRKMIKVTKQLVEKEPEIWGEALTEIEMEKLGQLNKTVGYGGPMTIRARLKGGYVRNNKESGKPDAHGTAFEHAAGWTFEPIDAALSHCEILPGTPFRIQNNSGGYLAADLKGVNFVDEPDSSGHATDFVLEPFSSAAPEESEADGPDAKVCLGENALLRCNATGQFLHISKEGVLDATGSRGEPQCQVVIDHGGQALMSGTMVTLAADIAGLQPVHGTPQGEVVVGDGGRPDDYAGSSEDWVFWLMEKKAGMIQIPQDFDGELQEGQAAVGHEYSTVEVGLMQTGTLEVGLMQTGDVDVAPLSSEEILPGGEGVQVKQHGSTLNGHSRDPRADEEALHEGDIVSLKSSNGKYMQVDHDGGITAGAAVLGAKPKPIMSQHFVIHKLGVSTITRHNTCIRRGDKICLKPVRPSGETRPDQYVKVNRNDGGLEANGTIFDREIGFFVEAQTVQQVVQPLQRALQRCDADIAFSRPGDKARTQHVEAMSAAWATEEDLKKVMGIVVVAVAGQYNVPMPQSGTATAWVAVADDGTNIVEAAQQAKARGANGIIIRCDRPYELELLMLGADPNKEMPCLPAAFVSHESAEVLNECGLQLAGINIRMKCVTEAMRAIGKAPVTKGKQANIDIFDAVGRTMLEREKELKAWKEKEETADTKSHYLWGGGGMQVNYGTNTSPSSQEQMLDGHRNVQSDVGTHRMAVNRNSRIRRATGDQKIRLSVISIDKVDFVQKQLGNGRDVSSTGLGEVLVEDASNEALEELSEESDFRIHYEFEEIEVDADMTHEEVEDMDLAEDGGREVEVVLFGAPKKKKFWVIAAGVGFSSILLVLILISVLSKKNKVKVQRPEDDMNVDIYAADPVFTSFAVGGVHDFKQSVGDAFLRQLHPDLREQMQAASSSYSPLSEEQGSKFV